MRSVIFVFLGTILGKVIAFLCIALVSQRLSVNDFSIYSDIQSAVIVSSIIGVGFSGQYFFRYVSNAPNVTRNKHLTNVLSKSLLVTIVMPVVMSMWYGFNDVKTIIVIIAISIVTSFVQVTGHYLSAIRSNLRALFALYLLLPFSLSSALFVSMAIDVWDPISLFSFYLLSSSLIFVPFILACFDIKKLIRLPKLQFFANQIGDFSLTIVLSVITFEYLYFILSPFLTEYQVAILRISIALIPFFYLPNNVSTLLYAPDFRKQTHYFSSPVIKHTMTIVFFNFIGIIFYVNFGNDLVTIMFPIYSTDLYSVVWLLICSITISNLIGPIVIWNNVHGRTGIVKKAAITNLTLVTVLCMVVSVSSVIEVGYFIGFTILIQKPLVLLMGYKYVSNRKN